MRPYFSTVKSYNSLLDDDDALESVWKKENSLKEFIDADQLKSYDDLKKRLEYVLGSKRPTSSIEEEDTDRGAAEELVTAAVSTTPSSVNEDDDDALSYFAKLAEE